MPFFILYIKLRKLIFAEKQNFGKDVFMTTGRPINLLTMEYPPMRGGAGVYCEELVHAAEKVGHLVRVLGPTRIKGGENTKIIKIPIKGSQDWTCSWKAWRFLKNQSFANEALHIAEPGALRAMIRFGWLLPMPKNLIITLHGSEIPKFSRNPIEAILFRKLLRRAHKIHVLSKHNEERLVRFCPKTKPVIVLAPGAPARNILPSPGHNDKRNYSKKKLILLSVGRIHPRKGQLELLQAVKSLSDKKKTNLTCWFAGPSTHKRYANKLKEMSCSVGANVEFLGDLSDEELRETYQQADIFALSSVPKSNSVEGFGFVYLEASAHGLPILANRTGGVEDAVLDGKTGVFADPESSNDLVEKLEQLLGEPGLRKTLGENGRKWAAQHDWQKTADLLYEPAA
jgi:phosphatidylinositol alpha-1,6-mannosyltransferase